ncbi:MAG: response regulator [Archaeoglobaceae archaeon]|nr:response regulator [Archaeoglobaceae archaeon]MDW8128035.1 response regulator [Archaeoglobaceae archaeon]
MKILIVEDDLGMVELLSKVLSKHDLKIARDGREAIIKFEQEKPDLVLMDIELPYMDGVSATREIRKIDPNAKIIAVTAFGVQRGKEIMREGAMDVIVKPFKVKDLLSRIDKVLKTQS